MKKEGRKEMKNKKTLPIIAGAVIMGLLGTNAYTYTQLSTAKDEVVAEKQEIERNHEAMDVFVSQIMNHSAQYASHEDMTLAFNIYASANRIHFKGNDYYVDLKDVTAHSFDEERDVKYEANVQMTFLKDKSKDGISYLQNQLPGELMEKAISIAKGLDVKVSHGEESTVHLPEGHEGETAEEHAEHAHEDEHAHGHEHDHAVHVPYVDTMAMEKEAKEPFEVHVWNQTLNFNMDGKTTIELTSSMKDNILKEFLLGVALKEKGLESKDVTIEIESLKVLDTITIYTNGETLKFSYNKDTKELKEN